MRCCGAALSASPGQEYVDCPTCRTCWEVAGGRVAIDRRPRLDTVAEALRVAGAVAKIAEAEARSLLQTGMVTRPDGRLVEEEASRVEARVDRALAAALASPDHVRVHAGTARRLGLRVPDHFGDGEDVILEGVSCKVDREADFARDLTVRLDFVARGARRVWQ